MKRRFDFRLQRLLRVREIEENIARSEWAQREAAAIQAEGEQASAAQAIQDARDYIVQRAEVGDGATPAWFSAAHRSIDGLCVVLRTKKEAAMVLRGKADEAKLIWREHDARQRGIAELEKRAKSRHRIELERIDNAELDEFASARTARKEVERKRITGRRKVLPNKGSDTVRQLASGSP